MIYLLYATKVNVGGWTTFTRHLQDSLEAMGEPSVIVKLGNRDEPFTRPFGGGYVYQNFTLPTLLREAKHSPVIITALGKHYVEQSEELIAAGARVVCHDPAEPAFRLSMPKPPWVIRRSMLEHLPHATFIRHPYVCNGSSVAKRSKKILATSRVDFDKNTTMILDANRLGANIDVVGFENRLYAKFKIMPNYPEWEQSGGYRRKKSIETLDLLRDALAMVDLTDIKGDGGGTQYTFLEAWDAGAVPVIGRWWKRRGDDMKDGDNCLMVSNAEELAATAKALRKSPLPDIAVAGVRRLARHHAPSVIVPQVMEWLNAN